MCQSPTPRLCDHSPKHFVPSLWETLWRRRYYLFCIQGNMWRVIRSPSSTLAALEDYCIIWLIFGSGGYGQKWNNICWTYQRIHRRWSDGRLPGACSSVSGLSLFHCVRSLPQKACEIQLFQAYDTLSYVNRSLLRSYRVISCFGACEHTVNRPVPPSPCRAVSAVAGFHFGLVPPGSVSLSAPTPERERSTDNSPSAPSARLG